MDFSSRLEISSEPDITLIQEFSSGRTDAFDRLYERYSSQVYNVCLSILGNPDDARDAMQDTFVQIYRSLPKFRGRSKFTTWLYRIIVNKCRDKLRSQPKWEAADSLEWIANDDEPANDVLLEEQVRRAMLKLKSDYRTVLVLYYFQQLTCDEIAETLNCSVDLVRVRLHRARKVFRQIYGGDENEV